MQIPTLLIALLVASTSASTLGVRQNAKYLVLRDIVNQQYDGKNLNTSLNNYNSSGATLLPVVRNQTLLLNDVYQFGNDSAASNFNPSVGDCNEVNSAIKIVEATLKTVLSDTVAKKPQFIRGGTYDYTSNWLSKLQTAYKNAFPVYCGKCPGTTCSQEATNYYNDISSAISQFNS